MKNYKIGQNLGDAIFKHVSEVIAIVDAFGNIKYESKSMEKIFGYKREEVIWTNILDRMHPDDRLEINRKLEQCYLSKCDMLQSEYRLINKDGKWCIVGIKMIYIPDSDDILLLIRDETEHRKTIKRAYYYEFNDQVTNLPNKELLINRLEREFHRFNRKNKSENMVIVLMMIGIKKFNYINEFYGIEAGDLLLRSIGKRLKKTFRSDDLVSKIDGDKFAVLFSDVAGSDAIDGLIRKIDEIFHEPFSVEDRLIKLSVSMGAAVYPHDGLTPNTLLKNCSIAMEEAKKNAGNSYALYDSKMNENLIKRMKIETELQAALENKEFKVFYQPKVNEEGYIIGMEALVRWYNPQRGIVPPSDFIHIMENNGMIIELDRFVLWEVCMQIRNWTDKGLKTVPVAVNISPLDLDKSEVVDFIRNTIKYFSINPGLIEIEITESGIMQHSSENIKKLHDMHALGVSISIDDFGTGQSSLSKLRDFPFDTIKIDKSFIDNVPENRESSILVKSIINLAHNLNHPVIAEGVEMVNQIEFLRNMYCDQFQGYYYSKPVSAEEIEEILHNELPLGISA